jgi:hypothetical protein
MITLNYTHPTENVSHISGTWQHSEFDYGEFKQKVIYVEGVMDLEATESSIKNTIQHQLDFKSEITED